MNNFYPSTGIFLFFGDLRVEFLYKQFLIKILCGQTAMTANNDKEANSQSASFAVRGEDLPMPL